MSNVFFTADTHFGHGNIVKYCNRPFLSPLDQEELDRLGSWDHRDASQWKITREAIELMDQTIISNINKMVMPDDTLWHLGDFGFGRGGYYKNCKAYRDRIACRNINIVWGNHDDYEIKDLFNKNYNLVKVSVNGQDIVLCHYAMAVWDKSHRGCWQLYGHSHAGAEPWMDKNLPGRRSFDVGVDNAYKVLGAFRPWSFDEIKKIMDKRTGFSMDHHVQH